MGLCDQAPGSASVLHPPVSNFHDSALHARLRERRRVRVSKCKFINTYEDFWLLACDGTLSFSIFECGEQNCTLRHLRGGMWYVRRRVLGKKGYWVVGALPRQLLCCPAVAVYRPPVAPALPFASHYFRDRRLLCMASYFLVCCYGYYTFNCWDRTRSVEMPSTEDALSPFLLLSKTLCFLAYSRWKFNYNL